MVSNEVQRERMVARQIAGRGVLDRRVLAAMGGVPRERFVPESLAASAYDDGPLPIGSGQTISQPYVVALMIAALEIRPGDTVLEVGAGSGYAACVLSRLATTVCAIERHAALARLAHRRARQHGRGNVRVRHGDGTVGWPECAPFDAILVSAGGPRVPATLRAQLAPGGRLVMPVGRRTGVQRLVRVRRTDGGRFRRETLGRVRFVPLIGDGGWAPDAADQRASPTATAGSCL